MSLRARNLLGVLVVAAVYALYLLPGDRLSYPWCGAYFHGLVPSSFAVAALLLLKGSTLTRLGLLNASLLLGAAVWAIVWYYTSSEFRSEGLLLWMFEALFAVLATNAIFIALLGLHRLVLLLRIPRGNS